MDIDPGAVEIAKLRLWLSLIVDEEDIKNIKPLPNFDYKIVCGNSLIGFPFKSQRLASIETLKKQFFSETHPVEKTKLKTEIDQLIQMAFASSKKSLGYEVNFDFEVYFSEVFQRKDGFDIVIANPPYVYNRNLSPQERKILQHKFGHADDLYVYFIYESVKILNHCGTLSFITPNTYFTLSTRFRFRSFLLKYKQLTFTYSGFCFSGAYVETMIMFLTNNKSKKNDLVKFIPKPNDYKSYNVLKSNISVFVENIYCRFFWPTKTNLELNRRFNKPLNKLALSFKDILSGKTKNNQMKSDYLSNLKIGELSLLGVITDGKQGLVTGNNSKYIGRITKSKNNDEIDCKFLNNLNKLNDDVDNTKYEDFINNRDHYYEIAETIKLKKNKQDYFGKFFLYKTVPLSQIKSYSELSNNVKQAGGVKDLWIYYNRGNPEGCEWFVNYSEIINWSQKYVKELKEGTITNSRWQGAEYFNTTGFAWVDYFTDKIKAFFVEEGVYSKNVVKLHSISNLISDKYIVALLNSTFISYYIKQFITSTHTLQINDGRLIPIRIPSTENIKDIENIVDKILLIVKDDDYLSNLQKHSNVKHLEHEIDRLVYKLYDLTPEEIKIVEGKNDSIDN